MSAAERITELQTEIDKYRSDKELYNSIPEENNRAEITELEKSILELNDEYNELLTKAKIMKPNTKEKLKLKRRLDEITDIIQDKSELLIELKKQEY